jgi:NTE family protein
MAMPGVVVPIELDGRTLVDGGVVDPLPTDVLVEMGVERIIAVNTIPNPEELRVCRTIEAEAEAARARRRRRGSRSHLNYFAHGNVLDVWSRSMHGAETRVAEGSCRQADVVIRPVSCDGKWHDFGRPRKYIALGRAAAEEKLEEVLALLGEPERDDHERPEKRMGLAGA